MQPEQGQQLSSEKAEGLDMDHVFVTFAEFLWGHYVIAPCAVYLWATGIAKLLLRQRLQKWGFVKPKPFQPEKVVAKLCLEGVGQVVHFVNQWETPEGQVACFVWAELPMMNSDGEFEVANEFTVNINLKAKKMVLAKLDGIEVSASDAMTILFFNSGSANHVKLHAYGNWGTNNEAAGHVADFIHQNSVTTVLYNYFGKSIFPKLCKYWHNWGIAEDWSKFRDVLIHGEQQGVVAHWNVRELEKHSEVVHFILRLRNAYLNIFAKHKEEFPGINGEAMFIGTVVHSLDHTLIGWNLEDPLWLDITSERFGMMAKISRFIRVGFVEDLPFLPLNKRYRTAPGAFYRDVYKQAAAINQRLADNMDTCIIK